ncbi:EscU/YscU/HrcU family type III secretion system export apparatus switch protein [Terrilactibacillus laevilacticus]|uniref:EscU/YscU/HrcU family type III secretion system export apparatus switch protein n=1 Tax=Terrilactibacillus laevilacticus TaxID=1380157 RepID=A0ABW5PPY5_9BACI|nr:EscU/YscU/HrcU family type III secretion system export apparatus switch protein [Terrilactibacillus laevilacticus]
MENSHQENSKKAIALRYQKDQTDSPVVTAKGTDHVAEQIIRVAKEHDIPIQEDENLVALLSELNMNDMIPKELYEAVSEIFRMIYHLDQDIKLKKS